MTEHVDRRAFLRGVIAATAAPILSAPLSAQPLSAIGVTGAHWWNGSTFVAGDVHIRDGRFVRRADRNARLLDFSGCYLIPPFADAHNHGLGTGDEARDREMIARYRRDGVLYMQSHGNFPLTAADRQRLGLGASDGIDASLAQGSITGVGGHSMGMIRDRLLPTGWFPGQTIESLDNKRFYQIDSLTDLQAKWPLVRAAQGDIVKFFLYNSSQHAARRADPAFFGRRGIDPALATPIVKLAHEAGLRASAHVVDVDDYRTALAAGADIIAHVPRDGLLTEADARQARDQGAVVITTCGFLARIAGDERQQVIETQKRNLTMLRQAGLHLAIGSDDPADTSGGEVAHLHGLGVFSWAELLAMWTDSTPRAIFPDRRIGRIADGFEASFLALEGNPLEDWSSTKRIRVRVKLGHVQSAA
jgi:imidazolonepropionase-like amidohydrolase